MCLSSLEMCVTAAHANTNISPMAWWQARALPAGLKRRQPFVCLHVQHTISMHQNVVSTAANTYFTREGTVTPLVIPIAVIQTKMQIDNSGPSQCHNFFLLHHAH